MAGRQKNPTRETKSTAKRRRKPLVKRSRLLRKPKTKARKVRAAVTRPSIFAGFHRDANRLATVEEVRDPNVPTRTVGELSYQEMVKLVSSRIKADDNFLPLHMLGVNGVIDKSRALEEVRSGSHVGLQLIEIEKEYIYLQLRRNT